jgi:PncC family amidohydrolase
VLEHELGDRLRQLGLTLAVAESCTGGLLSSRITDVAGASEYFRGGVVAYSEEVKERVLGVSPEVLRGQGAVSEACAREMAQGVRKLLGADLALATTGVAGPGGGTPKKPVGLVFIALATPEGVFFHKLDRVGSRRGNKGSASDAAIEFLLDHLEREPKAPTL